MLDNMAPLTLEQVSETLSSTQQGVMTMEDCVTRCIASSTGTFCMGFSGGVAAQVHYGKYLPNPVKALLLVPLGFGACGALAMYRHSMAECESRWTGLHHAALQHTKESG